MDDINNNKTIRHVFNVPADDYCALTDEVIRDELLNAIYSRDIDNIEVNLSFLEQNNNRLISYKNEEKYNLVKIFCGDKVNPLEMACMLGDVNIIKILIYFIKKHDIKEAFFTDVIKGIYPIELLLRHIK